jgi:hypothetical protein
MTQYYQSVLIMNTNIILYNNFQKKYDKRTLCLDGNNNFEACMLLTVFNVNTQLMLSITISSTRSISIYYFKVAWLIATYLRVHQPINARYFISSLV